MDAELDLAILNMYCNSNGLTLNASKTKIMHFRSPNRFLTPDASIVLNGTTVKHVFEFRYLGFVFDTFLKWVNKTDHLSTKLKQTVGLLYKTGKFLPQSVRFLVYYAMIHSKYLNT